MSDEHVYRVVFMNQGDVYELYARQVSQGGLYGFIEIEDLLFGERSQVVIDPSEERLKNEFEGVRRIHIPLHVVIRIDEVARQGASRIVSNASEGGRVAPFPVSLIPRKSDSDS